MIRKIFLLELSLFFAASVADGFASPPAIEAIARKAKAAYDEANFDEAARLFWQAFAQDRERGGWLYSAARAAHKAGHLDEAAERYTALIKDPLDAVDRVEAAKKYLAEVRTDQARELLRRASHSREAAIAYGLARTACDLTPADVQAWWQAAQSADAAKMNVEAVEAYRKVVALGAPGTPEATAASQRLSVLDSASLHPAKSVVVVEPEAAAPHDEARLLVPEVSTSSGHSVSRIPGMVTTFTGVAVALAGAGVFIYGRSLDSSLQSQLHDGPGGSSSLTQSEAVAKQGQVGTAETVGAVVAGAGLAVTVVGAILWWIEAKSESADAGIQRDTAPVWALGRF